MLVNCNIENQYNKGKLYFGCAFVTPGDVFGYHTMCLFSLQFVVYNNMYVQKYRGKKSAYFHLHK